MKTDKDYLRQLGDILGDGVRKRVFYNTIIIKYLHWNRNSLKKMGLSKANQKLKNTIGDGGSTAL